MVFPGLGWRWASRQLGLVQVLGEGPPDLNLLDPRVRLEHMPQSLVPRVGSETHETVNVTTATSVKA